MNLHALRHTARPGTDELLVRYWMIKARYGTGATVEDDEAAACTRVDPDVFFMQASPRSTGPNGAEAAALMFCAGCPIRDLCLLRDMAATSLFDLVGVRAGLRQVERRDLYRALERAGEL
ncbi:WhiB family transcriptional regulator [Streptomyces racemochromogenes]|uniref:WhiB family transcriptional regulator n=1 Tax=Streptomyces racemochromogenes TaxID=67353 RepID=UPI0035E8EED4